jgi:hypothetical protein
VHLPLYECEAEETKDIVVSDLVRAGFVLNFTKSYIAESSIAKLSIGLDSPKKGII